MAVLPVTRPTLLDLSKRTDPDGSIAQIVEMLQQENLILQDMVFQEGNLPTGHRTTLRTGIPTPTWRKINGGVQPTKSTTAQITFGTGMLEAYAEVDKALADLNGNTASWRMSEEFGHIEGMNQTMARTILYGNEGTQPEAFTGLTPYYNARTTSASGANIISANDATTPTDNQSIWLVGWGENTIHGIIPKGSNAGLQITDKGQVTIENADGAGGRMEGYRTHYRWDAGLAVRDWRYAVRICNISKALLTVDAATGPNLPNLMFQALEQIQSLSGVRPVFYMSRGLITKLRQQSAAAVKTSTLVIENVGGVMVQSFNGVPIKRVDALAADEAYVPASS
jgi:hypothetical protein